MKKGEGPEVPVKVFLVAGEPSGDALAARMMVGLKQCLTDQTIEFSGVGGPLMEKEGLVSLFPMDELTIMGIAEVLPKIPHLLKRIHQTAQSAIDMTPDVFISVDAPDFSFRVAKKLNSASFTKIHYVAPSVWAWRPGRAAKIARLYDHLLTLLPFEPPYFEKEGLSATFIGHSVIEAGADKGNRQVFRISHGFKDNDPILMVLPGSRRSEVSRHLDIFRETVLRVQKLIPELSVIVPVIGKSADIVREHLKSWPLKSVIIDGEQDKYDAMAGADVALAASGTVGLELALAKLPAVIAYKMHPITAYLARKLVKLDYVNLINILSKKEVVPEHLLENCKPSNLAPSLVELFENK
ncbi:MAG: lipid-A-disaccharide synthase, partial [Sneathiella sp.]|nr:lipid-A-disaccharide synthase [Sneathiella sp.]